MAAPSIFIFNTLNWLLNTNLNFMSHKLNEWIFSILDVFISKRNIYFLIIEKNLTPLKSVKKKSRLNLLESRLKAKVKMSLWLTGSENINNCKFNFIMLIKVLNSIPFGICFRQKAKQKRKAFENLHLQK